MKTWPRCLICHTRTACIHNKLLDGNELKAITRNKRKKLKMTAGAVRYRKWYSAHKEEKNARRRKHRELASVNTVVPASFANQLFGVKHAPKDWLTEFATKIAADVASALSAGFAKGFASEIQLR